MLPAKKIIPPAQLFLTSKDNQEKIIIDYLKTIFCSKKGCTTCEICLLIQEKQFYGAIWIQPEPRYTLDTIAPIFKQVEFTLELHDHVFFILQQADFLTPTCANSLLKLIEEPPAGYHFLFIAQHLHQVIVTIRSRCTITHAQKLQPNIQKIPFLQHFISINSTPQQFLKDLQNAQLQEITTSYYLDNLIYYWTDTLLASKKTNDEQKIAQASRFVALYQSALHTPIMTGSAKLFWKNIYLQKEEILRHV